MLSGPWRVLTPLQAPCVTRAVLVNGLSISSSPKCLPGGHSLPLSQGCSLPGLVPPSLVQPQQAGAVSCGFPSTTPGWEVSVVKQLVSKYRSEDGVCVRQRHP